MPLSSRAAALTILPAVLLGWQPGPGTEYKSEVSGIALRLPQGWTAQDHRDGILLMPPGVRIDPEAGNNAEVYFAVTQQGYDPADEEAFVQQIGAAFMTGGVHAGGGPRKEALPGSRRGSVYTWDLRDPSSGRVVLFQLYVAPAPDRAFGIVAFGEADRVRRQAADLKQIAATIGYATPGPAAGGPLSDDTPLARMWLQKLRGKLIRQFIGGGGAAGQKSLHLKADGTWSYRSSVAIAADVPGVSATSTSRESASGKWRIRDRGGEAWLQLTDADGKTELLSLTNDGRQWLLNGEKAFAVDP